jgi:hypothetical protein
MARVLQTWALRWGALTPLVTLLLLAGCSHDRDYDGGYGGYDGGGGGCCRGAMPEGGPISAVSASPVSANLSGRSASEPPAAGTTD